MKPSEGLEEKDKPDNFDQRLEELRALRDGMPQSYNMAANAIRAVLKGKDLNGTRENYYKGWEDIDLQNLLSLLGEPK